MRPHTRRTLPCEDESLGERRRLDRLRPAARNRRNLRGASRGRSRRCCRLLSESCRRTCDCGCKETPGQFRLVVHTYPSAVIIARLADALPGSRSQAGSWSECLNSGSGGRHFTRSGLPLRAGSVSPPTGEVPAPEHWVGGQQRAAGTCRKNRTDVLQPFRTAATLKLR